MISVDQADFILSNCIRDFGIEEVPLPISSGRILREVITADRDMPPFDRVSMDGIAIRFSAFEKGIKTFSIKGMAAAGAPQQLLDEENDCYEIMTGSILPIGADTIIPYEWLSIENNMATLVKESVNQGQNVHRKGLDRKQGDLLIPAGHLISPQEIGVLASVGKNNVHVSRLPKIMIISTGNELVEVEHTPLPHQVRMSNVYQLQSCVQQFQIKADKTHLQDDYHSITVALEKLLTSYDILIISGGISEGKFDFIPAALDALGVEKHFYKVQQRPGKPFWFGTYDNGCSIFAVPGNPVSSFLCYTRYIKPWVDSCLQKKSSPLLYAKLSEDIHFTPNLTYFMTVRLEQNENCEMIVIPAKGHGSGDLSNLVDADAFIELPTGRDVFRKGEIFSIYKF